MGSVRDFTDPVKQELLGAMREIQEQDREFWLLGGIFDGISDLFVSEDIAGYQGDIESYHRAMLDKKNTSAEQLEAIWAKAYEVDGNYARSFQDLADSAAVLRAVLDGLANTLDPTVAGANGIPALVRSQEATMGFLRSYRSPEYVADHRMQDEIEELLRQERFSEATWNAADAAERERILQEYHDEVRRIMGTDVNPDLVFGPLPIPLYGRYEHRTRQITIDGNSLAEANGYDAFDTIVHENRHAFQAEAVDGSGHHIVSDETRAIWTESFSRRIRNDDYQGQLELPTEWDARGFASEPQYGMAPPYDGSWQ